MRIAQLADVHARGKDLEAFGRQLTKAVTLAREKSDILVIAGDLYDNAQVGDRHASTGAITGVVKKALGYYYGQIIVIRGDHDQAGSGSPDALSTLWNMENVRTVSWPEMIRVEDVALFCMPWQWHNEDENYASVLLTDLKRSFEEKRAMWALDHDIRCSKVLLAHAQVIGKSFPYQTSGPKKWNLNETDLQTSFFDYVILGDFHGRNQFLGERGGYVGALRQMDYAHAREPQGFAVWNSETGETEWFEIQECEPHFVTEVTNAEEFRQYIEEGVYDDRRQRVVMNGYIPAPDEIRAVEERGLDLVVRPPVEERVTRATDLPEGILHKPAELLNLWAGAKGIEGAELEALHEELRACG